MNTGIQDAHNLVWKIAAMLRRDETVSTETVERLLCSYETERQPVAEHNAALSLQNFRTTLHVPTAIGLRLQHVNWLSRWIDRLALPQKMKGSLFRAAMGLGLKQVNWLHADNVLARRRRRILGSIFTDAKRQTLQLLFPGQDLEVVYRKGWLASRRTGAADPYQFDPFVFRPRLVIGGRMPHFWLIDHRGRRISTLDLPAQMTPAEKPPGYVMLSAGYGQQAPPLVDNSSYRQFLPLVTATISSHAAPENRGHFSFDPSRPAFLPRTFSVIIRPDGHLAWLHIPD